MNARPLISIVTISFNQVEYLNKCLGSIINQLDSDVEYIVVDPGSTDGSRELIESYGDKIKRVFMPDKGPADGLNNGFKVASGQYFYFINSDDMLLPNAISEMKSAIQNSVKKYDVYCFGGYMIDAKSRNLRPLRTFNYSSSNFCRGGTSIFQQGLLFSSIKYIEAGGFDINNRTCWDARLMFDLATNGASFCDVNKKIACFRIHDKSITGSANNLVENQKNKDKMFEECIGRSRNNLDIFVYNILRFKKYLYVQYSFETLMLKLKKRG